MHDPEDKSEETPAPEEIPSEAGPGDEPAEDTTPTAAESESAEADSEAVDDDADAEPEVIEIVPEPTAEERLQQQLDEAQARLRAVSKAYKDGQAEMQAFRERMENQARFKAERQAFDQARAFFDPVQNLKRSIESGDAEHGALLEGLQMILGQFMDALKKLGMEEVPGVGSQFNPHYHEALAITPVPEAAQDGKVLMVHAGGYTVNGKVLQAAQVVVGKYQEPAGEA